MNSTNRNAIVLAFFTIFAGINAGQDQIDQTTLNKNNNSAKSATVQPTYLETLDGYATFGYRGYQLAHRLGRFASFFTRWAIMAYDQVPETAKFAVTQLKRDPQTISWKLLPENSADVVRHSGSTIAINMKLFSQLTEQEQQLAVAQKVIRSSYHGFFKDFAMSTALGFAVSYGLNIYVNCSGQAFDYAIDKLQLQPDDMSYKLVTTLKSTNNTIARSALTKAFLTYYIQSKINQSRELSATAAATAVLDTATSCASIAKNVGASIADIVLLATA